MVTRFLLELHEERPLLERWYRGLSKEPDAPDCCKSLTPGCVRREGADTLWPRHNVKSGCTVHIVAGKENRELGFGDLGIIRWGRVSAS